MTFFLLAVFILILILVLVAVLISILIVVLGTVVILIIHNLLPSPSVIAVFRLHSIPVLSGFILCLKQQAGN